MADPTPATPVLKWRGDVLCVNGIRRVQIRTEVVMGSITWAVESYCLSVYIGRGTTREVAVVLAEKWAREEA